MEWKYCSGVSCGECSMACLKLNEFGLCAGCWSRLEDDERAVFFGTPDDVRRVVTYSLPAKQSRLESIAACAMGMLIGQGLFVGAAAFAHWMRWL